MVREKTFYTLSPQELKIDVFSTELFHSRYQCTFFSVSDQPEMEDLPLYDEQAEVEDMDEEKHEVGKPDSMPPIKEVSSVS